MRLTKLLVRRGHLDVAASGGRWVSWRIESHGRARATFVSSEQRMASSPHRTSLPPLPCLAARRIPGRDAGRIGSLSPRDAVARSSRRIVAMRWLAADVPSALAGPDTIYVSQTRLRQL